MKNYTIISTDVEFDNDHGWFIHSLCNRKTDKTKWTFFLHNDLVYRETTRHNRMFSGYYASKDDAQKTLDRLNMISI